MPSAATALGMCLELLVEAGDHQPGEIVVGLQVDSELLEDQREVGALIARIGAQDAADVEQDLGDAGGGASAAWASARWGRSAPSITTESLYFSPKVFSSCARLVGLAEAAQAVGGRDAWCAGRRIELDGAAVLGLGRRLVARHLVDLRLDHQRRRLGALARGGLQLGKTARAPAKSFSPALSQAIT